MVVLGPPMLVWLAHLSSANLTSKSPAPPESYGEHLTSGAFVEATFENWESEFLQMAAYVVLTRC
jgi:hypothetical protein